MTSYRHRVSGGPRTPRLPEGEKKTDTQAHVDMLERMVTRFAERIRVLEALHTLRIEEAGVIIGTIFILYKKWKEMCPEEPDRASSFTLWAERLTAEEVVQYATGRWQDQSPCSSGKDKRSGDMARTA
jgi:hypothetical protein